MSRANRPRSRGGRHQKPRPLQAQRTENRKRSRQAPNPAGGIWPAPARGGVRRERSSTLEAVPHSIRFPRWDPFPHGGRPLNITENVWAITQR